MLFGLVDAREKLRDVARAFPVLGIPDRPEIVYRISDNTRCDENVHLCADVSRSGCSKQLADSRQVSQKGDLFPRIFFDLLSQPSENNRFPIGDAHLVLDIAARYRRTAIGRNNLRRIEL